MLKGEDIIVLLKLSGSSDDWTVRGLSEGTSVPRSVVQRAVKRLSAAGLVDDRRRQVNFSQAEEFILHGLRYVFPPVLGGEGRGVPTAWAAEPLVGRIASAANELQPVWADAHGDRRGLILEPVHPAAAEAARRDPELGQLLALVDGLRLGDARIRGVASELLRERLGRVPV
jgi:hypothetical protein